MSKPTAVLLGGHPLNRGVVDRLHAAGYRVVVIDWNEHPALTGDLHLRIDVKQFRDVVSGLKFAGIQGIDFAYTSIDLAVGTLNSLLKWSGLRHASTEAVFNSMSKDRMRKLWQGAGLYNREGNLVSVENVETAVSMANSFSIIVKPNQSSSSRGITILDQNASFSDVRGAVEKACKESFDGMAIVEEFVHGQEFTVEMVGDESGRVAVLAISVKYHTKNTVRNKIAVKLHYNSLKYPATLYAAIADVARRCYRALGLQSSLGHLEMIVTSDGRFCPLEIGARSSGFIASHLVDASSTLSLLRSYEKVIHGDQVTEGYFPSDQASMYFFYDLPAGSRAICSTNITEFLAPEILSLYHDRSALVPGTLYKQLTNDNERYGYEILVGPQDVLTEAAVFQAENAFFKKLIGTEQL